MIHLIIPGRPPRKNELYMIAVKPYPRLVLTDRSRDYFAAVKKVVDSMDLGPCITWGTWRVSILAAHDKRTMVDEFEDLSALDVDAPNSLTLDALQRAGVIDNDARVTEEVIQKCHDKENPRVEIWLEPIT